MMDKIIMDIEKANENECYYAALALALTIPDVCSKYDKSIKDKGRDAYAKWYNCWVTKNDYMNGYHCYALRCSFLHALDADIEKQKKAYEDTGDKGKNFSFKLMTPDTKGLLISFFYEEEIENEKITVLDIALLSNNLVRGYRKFIKNYPNLSIENKNILFK